MQAGSRVELSGIDGIAMRYNAELRHIEFLSGDHVIGFLNTDRRNVNLAE